MGSAGYCSLCFYRMPNDHFANWCYGPISPLASSFSKLGTYCNFIFRTRSTTCRLAAKYLNRSWNCYWCRMAKPYPLWTVKRTQYSYYRCYPFTCRSYCFFSSLNCFCQTFISCSPSARRCYDHDYKPRFLHNAPPAGGFGLVYYPCHNLWMEYQSNNRRQDAYLGRTIEYQLKLNMLCYKLAKK